MNTATATTATTDAMRPARIESAPRPGPTVRSSTTVSATGSLPERSAMASRSEEHTSELQSLMRISYAVFCLQTKTADTVQHITHDAITCRSEHHTPAHN